MEDENQKAEPERSGSSSGWAWPLAFMVVGVALIGLAALLIKSCSGQPGRLAESAAKALQPQVTVNTVIQTSLDRLRDESKLVVYTANISVMVTKTSEKKILYGKLNLGQTTVRLRAAGNKAQLIVPLKSLRESDFQFDEAKNELVVTIPAPRVDEQLVEVQTDPTFYEVQTDVGWARLAGFSGEFLKEQALRDLRPAVVAEASDPRILEMAKQSAREKVAALIEPALKQVRTNAVVEVRFKPASGIN